MTSGDIRQGLRLIRWGLSPQRRRMARGLLARADDARASRLYRDAAILFEELARLWPRPGRFHVQAGHMFKEAGDLGRAEAQYRIASSLQPEDADLALQMGHFYKVARRPGEALAAYRRALSLRPGWTEAAGEVANMEGKGAGVLLSDASLDDFHEDAIVELLPSAGIVSNSMTSYGIELRKLGGRREPSRWGRLPLMSGVEAVRGIYRTDARIDAIELALGGKCILRTAAAVPVEEPSGVRKYVFNLWFDLSEVQPGPYRFEVRMLDAGRIVAKREDAVLIATAPQEDWAQSDGLVLLDQSGDGSVEQRVNALPSVAHPAARDVLGPVDRILVLRTDQLGDMVISIPALRRLRELFPAARIVGLLTAANADLGRSTGLFDEVVDLQFPVDPIDQRRVLTREAQSALRDRLSAYAFDLCIDLGVGHLSRPLMRLAGARVLVGVNDREWPWLTVGLDGDMHDPKNHNEAAPHSAKLLALVERLATLRDSGARIVRRSDLSEGRLNPFGIAARDYIILHCGAAQLFTRWPHFAELAERLLDRYPYHIVIIGAGDIVGESAFAALTVHPRVSMITRILPFDDFDALLSFAALFVGNDSGPKHLAALRGVPVISLHNARTNWGEWGQEQTGVILSRRVPCAGCSVIGDGHECGRSFACLTKIRAEEVMRVAETLLPVSPTEPAAGVGA